MSDRHILSFDYGTRHIGVAVGQRRTGSAQELTQLKARDGIPNWEEIKALINEWQPGMIVIGLPLNMDGSESALSQRTRKFARRIEGRFNIKTELIDERLTTHEAKLERTDKTSLVDSKAARIILEDWLRANRRDID